MLYTANQLNDLNRTALKDIARGLNTGLPLPMMKDDLVAFILANQEAQPEPTPAQPEPTPAQAPQAAHNGLAGAVAALVAELQQVQASSIDEQAVIALIEQHSKQNQTIEITHTDTGIKKEIKNTHKAFKRVLMKTRTWRAQNKVPYLVGEAGTGKTTLCKQIAEALDLPFFLMGATYDRYDLSGFKNAQGEATSTQFREAFINGGVILLDEYDYFSEECLSAINAALANQKFGFPDGLKLAHENFYPIMAGNTSGRGDSETDNRNVFGEATLDRIAPIKIELDIELALNIAEAQASAACEQLGETFKRDTVSSVFTVWQAARSYAQVEKLPVTIGARDLISMMVCVSAHGETLSEAAEQTSIATFTPEQLVRVGL